MCVYTHIIMAHYALSCNVGVLTDSLASCCAFLKILTAASSGLVWYLIVPCFRNIPNSS